MVEQILNNTTPYGKIRASHEGWLHSSTLSAFPHRHFHTLPGLLDSWLHCQTPTLTHACLCREAVFTIFMKVFGMTRGTTYRARGGHATD